MKPPSSFSEFPLYTDPGAINQLCRDVLLKGGNEASQLQMGICELTGPGRMAEDVHMTWTQYFLIVEGEGALYLGEEHYPLAKDMIVEIPKGTRHFTQCEAGSILKYFFINVHDV